VLVEGRGYLNSNYNGKSRAGESRCGKWVGKERGPGGGVDGYEWKESESEGGDGQICGERRG